MLTKKKEEMIRCGPVIYALVKDGDVFYVGQTKDLRQRLSAHKSFYGHQIEARILQNTFEEESVSAAERKWVQKLSIDGCDLHNCVLYKSLPAPMPEITDQEFAEYVKHDAVREIFVAMGRKGGLKGGKRRLETMTPEERSESARKAAAKSAEVRSKKAAAKRRAAKKKS